MKLFLVALALTLTAMNHPLAAGEAILVGAGDIAKCGPRLENAEQTARLIDQVIASQGNGPDAPEIGVFTVGDHVYPKGTARNFAECYQPTWGRHKDRTRPAPGNHEYRVRGAAPYYQYFGAAANPPGGYFSYDLGDWHIVVLNSVCGAAGGCGPGSPQYRWLQQDLSVNRSRCALAYFHHPLFSSARGAKREMRPLAQVLYQFGVDVVISGHDHHYERFAPQNPEGLKDPEKGFRQFIAGTGGRGKRWFVPESLGRRTPNSEAANDKTFGVLKLTLHPESYEWEFLAVPGGDFQDSGQARCN